MARIDLNYLKKRAHMTDDFCDEKVKSALAKIIPEPIDSDSDVDFGGLDIIVPNKLFRNWIDLIPENMRGFVRFEYRDGGRALKVEDYIKIAMTKPAYKTFQSFVSKDMDDGDLYLSRYLVWHSVVLKRPVGFDFGKYEMNMIFNSLPIDISKDKVKFEVNLSFAEFYRQIKFAEKVLRDVN